MHRYTDPGWLVRRLHQPAEKVIGPRLAMRVRARSERHFGERELALLPRLVPKDRLAIDVGAADGVYTWYLQRLSAGCVAFEPNPVNAAAICRRVPRAMVHNVALSDADGIATLRIPVANGVSMAGLATLHEQNALAEFDSVVTLSVPKRSLDSYGMPRVGFIKIDVEGHELSVVRGATDLIKRDRPAILAELEDRHRPDALQSFSSFLAGLGYGKPNRMASPQNFLFVFEQPRQAIE